MYGSGNERRLRTAFVVRVAILVTLAMIAFAANSLLCRMALKNTAIDAGSFTSTRIISGAVVLWLIVLARGNAKSSERIGGRS